MFMITICCTSRLLKRTGFPAETLVPEPTSALGNWYANILFFHHRQALLFVSERSRLGVVTPAKEIRSLSNRLTEHLPVLLKRLNAKPEWIQEGNRKRADVRYAAPASRSVLGTMNDYKIQIEALLEEDREASEIAIAFHLRSTPIGPLQYKSPEEVTLQLLKSSYEAG